MSLTWSYTLNLNSTTSPSLKVKMADGGWRRRHRRTDAEQGDVFSAEYKERCVRYGLESVETMEVDEDDVPAGDGGLAQLGVESGAGKKRDHCPGCRRSLLVEKST